MLVRPLEHRAVCGFAPLARNPLLSVSSVILLGTAELARSEECWSQLAGHEPQCAIQTNCFAEANFGRCQRVVSFFLLSSPFSLVLFLCSLIRGCSVCRSHLPQSLLSVHGYFFDYFAVPILGPPGGPNFWTPTPDTDSSLSTASPGHVIHFAVQPEHGRLIGIFPCSQKVEITLRRDTLHLSRFWLETFRVALMRHLGLST